MKYVVYDQEMHQKNIIRLEDCPCGNRVVIKDLNDADAKKIVKYIETGRKDESLLPVLNEYERGVLKYRICTPCLKKKLGIDFVHMNRIVSF